jgi:hypothetical protein
VEYFPVGDDGRKQLPEFVSNIDLVDGLPFVGENPVEREEDVVSDHAPVTATFELYPMRPGLEPVQIYQSVSQVEFSEVCHVTTRREPSSTANKTIKAKPTTPIVTWARSVGPSTIPSLLARA